MSAVPMRCSKMSFVARHRLYQTAEIEKPGKSQILWGARRNSQSREEKKEEEGGRSYRTCASVERACGVLHCCTD